MIYKVNVLLNIFDKNMGIWLDDEEGIDVWIRLDDGEVLEKIEPSDDGLPQFVDIKNKNKSGKWFLDLIFKIGRAHV